VRPGLRFGDRFGGLLVGLFVAWILAGAPAALAQPTTAAPASAPARGAALFEAWRVANTAAMRELEQHLAQQDLATVLPLEQLLRSASSWHECKAEPYAVPPPAQWPAVISVLRLLRELRAAGVVAAIEVHSGFRESSLNTCAGGAPRSAHHRSFAIDFTPVDSPDPTARLCDFWRTHGRRWAMGLSRYPSGRIHIDTSGHRTWGADHTGRSAVCDAP